MTDLYIGIMSGTSLDGADAVLADFSGPHPRQLAHLHQPFPASLRDELSALCQSGPDEIHRAQQAALRLAHIYGDLVIGILERSGLRRTDIRAVGCHGQTVRHMPSQGYTLQINAPALLAELTGICTVSDFRSRDIAAGGQGAPLVPAFHAQVFADERHSRAVLNLGGMANITLLDGKGYVRGFDCGPANILMDGWIEHCRGLRYDANGAWAASGTVNDALLQRMKEHPFFALQPPKSCGREQFHLGWIFPLLPPKYRGEDVQATLAELTAQTVAEALRASDFLAEEITVCGGGAFNAHVMKRLELATGSTVMSTAAVGIAPDTVEALAFAWLARQAIKGEPGNVPEVTGASGPRVLGAIWHA